MTREEMGVHFDQKHHVRMYEVRQGDWLCEECEEIGQGPYFTDMFLDTWRGM